MKSNIILIAFNILFLLWVVFGLYRCSQESDIYELAYGFHNPIEYVFPYSCDTLQYIMEHINEGEPGKDFKLIKINRISQDSTYFYLETRMKRGSYLWHYKGLKKRDVVSQHLEHAVKLIPISNDSTKVMVKNINQRLHYGVLFWRDLTFSDNYRIGYTKTSSSTIEEYELLRYIGKRLNYINLMPFVKYPEGLSKEEILIRFGSNNPFTMKEMFCDEEDDTVIGNRYSN